VSSGKLKIILIDLLPEYRKGLFINNAKSYGQLNDLHFFEISNLPEI
jgi:hypothetical protein